MTELHVQQGMRSVIRDIMDFTNINSWSRDGQVLLDADELRAYLLALLITAGAYDDLTDDSTDGEG